MDGGFILKAENLKKKTFQEATEKMKAGKVNFQPLLEQFPISPIH